MARSSKESERKKKKKSTDEYSGKAAKSTAPSSDPTRQTPLDSTANQSRDSSTSSRSANKKRDDGIRVSGGNGGDPARHGTPDLRDNAVRDLNDTIAGAATKAQQVLPSASRANFTPTYVMKATSEDTSSSAIIADALNIGFSKTPVIDTSSGIAHFILDFLANEFTITGDTYDIYLEELTRYFECVYVVDDVGLCQLGGKTKKDLPMNGFESVYLIDEMFNLSIL